MLGSYRSMFLLFCSNGKKFNDHIKHPLPRYPESKVTAPLNLFLDSSQGYRLEGEYFEETDAGTESKVGASKFNSNSGPFSATLEKQALSG